jgi:NAD(P)H dehydrogenase (quinone)
MVGAIGRLAPDRESTLLRYLVVYCHPFEGSFCAKLHANVLEGLSAAGHEVIDLDLYAEGFSSVLSRQEFIDYRDSDKNTLNVRKYIDQLLGAQGIVLVYPTWWYGMPAMLKGYFDRVWLPGTAFDIGSKGEVVTGRLKHICSLVTVTTYGSPWWLNRVYMGDPGRKIVTRGLRQLCASDCRVRWYAKYDVDRASPKALKSFADRVRRQLERL